MRKLKLLCLTAVTASLAGGCIIEDGDGFNDEFGFITATWDFHNVAATRLACPTGFDTAEVIATPINGGTRFIDLYDCDRFAGTSDYDINDYDVVIRIKSRTGSNVYAKSLTYATDITFDDQTVSEDFIDDGGRFLVDWTLVQGGSTVSCSQAGNPDAIQISTTVAGSSTVTTQRFACVDGSAISSPLIAGDYTVSLQALNANGIELGDSVDLVTDVKAPNGYTDLPTISIPIGATTAN